MKLGKTIVAVCGIGCLAFCAFATHECNCTGTCGKPPQQVAPSTVECADNQTCGCLIDCTANPPTATASCESQP